MRGWREALRALLVMELRKEAKESGLCDVHGDSDGGGALAGSGGFRIK